MSNPYNDESAKNKFVEYLDSEIKRIQDEMAQPGWTNWAILGGVATVSWLILQEWESGSFNFDFIFALVLAGIVTYFCSMPIRALIYYDDGGHSQKGDETRFIVTSQIFGTGRFIGIYLLANLMMANLLAYRLADEVVPLLTMITFVFLVIYTLAFLFIVVLSFLKFPFPKKVRSSKSGLFSLILLSFTGLYSSINYGRFVILAEYPSKLSDIRLVLLLLAGLYLLSLLLSSQSQNPLLQNLIVARRDLALGRIDIKDAKEQAKIALLGLRVADVLQEYISNVLSRIEERNIVIQKTITKLEEADKFVLADEELSEEEYEVYRTSMLSVNSALKELLSFESDFRELLAPIERRIIFMKSFADVSSEEIKEVWDIIGDSMSGSVLHYDEMTGKADFFQNRITRSLEKMLEAREEEISQLRREGERLLDNAEQIETIEKEVAAKVPKLHAELTAEEIRRIEETIRKYEKIRDAFLAFKAEIEERGEDINDN